MQSELDKSQREYVLRQQLKAIQEELGEFDESAAEAEELREQLAQIELPEDVRRQVDRELKRLESLPPARGRARRHPHVPGVDRLPAVGQAHRRHCCSARPGGCAGVVMA